MRRRQRRLSEPPPSHSRWLVSYADLITLLFAFFTVLYASSNVDARKLSSMVTTMQQVFDTRVEGVAAPATVPPEIESIAARNAELVAVSERLKDDLRSYIDGGGVTVGMDPRGVVVSIQETGSFVTGRADLPPAAEALVRRIAAGLGDLPNPIRVEGHTDDVPIQTTRYESNWDLSTARATRVVDLLMRVGIGADRLSAAGYSEFHPRVPNDSAEHRARNRRVDLVILNTATATAEEPGGRHP